ncbi:hypothetical protein BDB01DRAFT_779708 [Pilobolus umbonatus]|nr:hypothetical protein BDB01DRAFT_779708 [Pilobolus umbonatus]
MEAEPSRKQCKLVEYKNSIYKIPVRYIDNTTVILLSDIQSIIPQATALLSYSQLIPFHIDPVHYNEITPKRVSLDDYDSIWEVHVPEYNIRLLQTTLETQHKVDKLSDKVDRLLYSGNARRNSQGDNSRQTTDPPQEETSSSAANTNGEDSGEGSKQSEDEHMHSLLNNEEGNSGSHSPPPAFSSPSIINHEAPPSYETSVLGNVELLNSKIRLYEAHIQNRYKSPRWLSIRSEWINNKPHNIEQVAFQFIQLESALFYASFSEPWAEERETWLTVVRNARSERHLAGALLNLERHTAVLDEDWTQLRESWISDLLEMVVLPITHG